jgi:phospholipid/cholesterol/gamma-HCH transport system ATP-binding protein
MNYKVDTYDRNHPEQDDNIRLNDESTIIEIVDLKKSFGSNHVLKGFNLKVQRGEIVAILGRSGSGKSVLIKCIVALVTPDSGTISVFGKNIFSLGRKYLDEMRARIGFLFQSNALYDSMTVNENLAFPLRRNKITTKELNMLRSEVLTNVGLPLTGNLLPSELSGGMKKRIGLARTMILKPEIIVYDEPTTGLDPITAGEISELMIQMNEKHEATSIIISHDIACIRKVAHRIVVLINGVNHAEGTYEELANSSDEQVNAFFK